MCQPSGNYPQRLPGECRAAVTEGHTSILSSRFRPLFRRRVPTPGTRAAELWLHVRWLWQGAAVVVTPPPFIFKSFRGGKFPTFPNSPTRPSWGRWADGATNRPPKGV